MCLSFTLTSMEYHDVISYISLSRMSVSAWNLPGRRAHVNYENINNSNLDGMSLASFCQSRAVLFEDILHFECCSGDEILRGGPFKCQYWPFAFVFLIVSLEYWCLCGGTLIFQSEYLLSKLGAVSVRRRLAKIRCSVIWTTVICKPVVEWYVHEF